jgi:hypothetical protein
MFSQEGNELQGYIDGMLDLGKTGKLSQITGCVAGARY